MQGKNGQLRFSSLLLHAGLLLTTSTVLIFGDAGGRAQMGNQPQLPSQSSQGSARPPFGQGEEAEQNPAFLRAQQAAAKKRNINRQQRMVAESDRLLQLAMELKTEVDKEAKSSPALLMVKQADEIERLAKSVKERMKAE